MSEAEKPEPKTVKRIVSRGEYVLVISKKIWLFALSTFLALVGLIFAISVLLSVFAIVYSVVVHDYSDIGIMLIGVLMFLALACASGQHCTNTFRSAVQIDEGMSPLTRANTGDLPAPESLVRASAEPIQAQEAVLLRAASQGSKTPTEQLVRPIGEQE